MITLLSDDDTKVIRRAALRVFDEVAGDMLTMLAEEGQGSMTRAEVLEVVCDAGRLEQVLRRDIKRPDLADYFSSLDYQAMKTLLKPAFPHARYS